MASASTASSIPSDHVLTKDQITALIQNCITLASENKINQKNTWKLNLIDHLSEIIKAETEAGAEINFEKASCTLEVGVKIYSLRVDSAHSLAFKLLAQIIRTGEEDQQETEEGVDDSDSEGFSNFKKETKQKISPFSTVEQSFESLNMRKFDGNLIHIISGMLYTSNKCAVSIFLDNSGFPITFVVGPDYHQKLIPYDEGGVQGLLLYNLGVYGNCRVLFDCVEDPNICISDSKHMPNLDTIDLSSLREEVAHMIINMHGKHNITPIISTVVSQSQIGNLCCLDQFNGSPKSEGEADAAADGSTQPIGHLSSYSGEASCSYNSDTNSISYDEVNGKYGEFAACLFQGLEFPPKHNTWKGTDHWKYQNAKGSEEFPAMERRSNFKQRSKKNELLDNDIKFTTLLVEDLSSIFAPPRNPKSLLLPVKRDLCSNRLLGDCHYLPEDLLKLFLCPNIKFFGKRQTNPPDIYSRHQTNGLDEETPECGNGNGYGRLCDDEYVKSYSGLPDPFVSETHQVLQTEVHYDKAPKQADMHILKGTLWDHIQQCRQITMLVSKDQVSFKGLLATFPAATLSDGISPHLCFICLLHLANEHSLNIKGNPNLDDLTIHLPC